MLREITVFLALDASGWKVISDDEVNRIILTGDPRMRETWRVLKVAVESPPLEHVGIAILRRDLDQLFVQNLTRRINDEQEDPMQAAEAEAARLEEVEGEFTRRMLAADLTR